MMIGILLKPLFNMIIKGLKIKTECFSYHLFQSLRTFILMATLINANAKKDAFTQSTTE